MKLSYPNLEAKEFLIKEYKENGKTAKQIAKEFGKKEDSIQNLLHKFGIRRDFLERDTIKINEEDLRRKYLEEKLTIEEIGNFYGLGKSTIQYKIKKFNIPTRLRRKNKIDLTGQIFGKLSVIELVYKKCGKYDRKFWKCECDCKDKTIVLVTQGHLLSGHSKSCRCVWKTIGPGHPSFKGYGELSHTFWGTIKASASVRNIEFAITIEFAWNLFIKQNRKCALSGVDLEMHPMEKSTVRNTASLDRIDSSKDYTEDNVQWVHKKLNRMKVNMLDEEFIKWCTVVAEFNRNKNATS